MPAASATNEVRVLRLAKGRGLLRARDLVEHGLPTVVLTRLVQAGKLKRMGRTACLVHPSASTDRSQRSRSACRKA